MSSATEAAPNAPALHKRTPSAVFKSIVATRDQKTQEARATSPAKLPSPTKQSTRANQPRQQQPLGEINHNRERGRTREEIHRGMEKPSLHEKRARSVISLKGITGRDRSKQPAADTKVVESTSRFKKSKSSTNLAALLPRPKATKADNRQDDQKVKNKENQPPIQSIKEEPAPIWAEFAGKSEPHTGHTTKVPLNDTEKFAEEASLYTPQEYSPSKGRMFFEQPSLAKPNQERSQSRSGNLQTTSSSTQLMSTFNRLRKASSSSLKKESGKQNSQGPGQQQSSSRPTTADGGALQSSTSKPFLGTSKGGSRVKAAVAAFSGKASNDTTPAQGPKETKPSRSEVEVAFERMLESRNIPPDVREKMRALDTNIKADLIKKNSAGSPSVEGAQWSSSRPASRPGTAGRAASDVVSHHMHESEESEKKKPRPRSLTFTLNKGDQSPSKKQKAGKGTFHGRNKSADLPRSTSSTSLNSIASSSSFKLFNRAPKPPVPDDFISYLRKEQKPQDVEVGKIQKLRQLLRNETVAWVDEFIVDGGMIELVNLLYRIIEIEWREEHEDNLLHHTLTCLKALTTTSSAVKQLDSFQSKLFPTLLALLFSSGEEKKGPAEFPTRGLIISLLFSYLSASPTPSRAATLLGYLRDPSPAETVQPLGFIADMRRSRPYKLWCTEVANVAKEVFWIFLHSVNVVPYPQPTFGETHYCSAHFPAPRPPVPAAPYVGSVEWDATTYLAVHLDLLNGLIASIPTMEERNTMRRELRDSGFEKVMGGQLRLCKEKFYGHVHAGLITWVGAARADGWNSKDVREGPPKDDSRRRAKSSSPAKKKAEKAPVLDMPKLDLGIGVGDRLGLEAGNVKLANDDWL